MNKEQFADSYSLLQWIELCKNNEFVDAFWNDDFVTCRKIAKDIICGKEQIF